MTKNLFKYVGLGVKIIFHPLASELDRLLSRKMKFKFGKLLLLGVVLSFIVTSTLWRCFIEQLNANVVACTAYQHSPVKFNAHYLVMFRYEIIYNIQVSNIRQILKILSGFETGISSRFKIWLEDAQLRIVPSLVTINITYLAICYTKEFGNSHIAHSSRLYMLWLVML